MAQMIYDNSLLLDVFHSKQIERPPVWIMRQAGRTLPGYRFIRSQVSGFKELVKSPDLIAEVTTEPLEVLNVDAAILFSDILVIPEAMGLDYELVEKKGPVFPSTIKEPRDIDQLKSGEEVLDSLNYVFESIDRTKKRIDGKVPLIGFAGAPWTLFAYMLEGSGSKTFSNARRFLYQFPDASHRLLEKLTTSIIVYLKEKVRRGCNVIQLFDSWANMLPVEQYCEFSNPYVHQIFSELDDTPTIFFPKGAWSAIPHMSALGFDAISIDWTTYPDYVRKNLDEEIIIQGNLDPTVLYADKTTIEDEVVKTIHSIGSNHIFNLGHGVYPDTDVAHIKHMVECVKNFRYDR